VARAKYRADERRKRQSSTVRYKHDTGKMPDPKNDHRRKYVKSEDFAPVKRVTRKTAFTISDIQDMSPEKLVRVLADKANAFAGVK
jgi:hypothetical protein